VLHKGQARKILPRLSPSRLKRMPQDWADLYKAADDDHDVLSIKSRIPLIKQLEARWPSSVTSNKTLVQNAGTIE
jgi:hypothetical protein